LHFTRQDGLSSNIIFALALGPDETVWAATDEGVSRIQAMGAEVRVTTFSALHGLALPVRDIAVGPDGTPWLATDGGVFRIMPHGGLVQGVVHDPMGRPLAGVDITGLGTPFRAVTDENGHFVLANLPSGPLRLRVDGRQASVGRLTRVFRELVVPPGDHTIEPFTLVRLLSGISIDTAQGGSILFPEVPGAVLEVDTAAVQFPPGVAAEFSLTLIPPTALPFPLPEGFTVGAAVELQPDGTIFTVPAELTLPNQGGLPAGQAAILLRLDETTLTYVPVGRGRVSDDGTVITTTSGGLRHLSTVVFASVPAGPPHRLVIAAGAGQTGVVETVLPVPLPVMGRSRHRWQRPVSTVKQRRC
jgi:hypothetical protein